jgi:AcrR family transcriptional regulator
MATAKEQLLINNDVRTYSNDEALVKARRMQIIKGATRLFVKKGYDRTNMREVTKACNMSMGALYHYVGSKEDILYLIIDHGLSNLAETIEELCSRLDNVSPTDAIREFIKIYYQGVDRDPDFVLFTYQETKNLSPSARRHVLESAARDVTACEGLLRRGMEAGEFIIDNPILMAHKIIVLGHIWAVRRWFLRKQCTLEGYIREQTESVLKTIARDNRATCESPKSDLV